MCSGPSGLAPERLVAGWLVTVAVAAGLVEEAIRPSVVAVGGLSASVQELSVLGRQLGSIAGLRI